MFQFHGWSVLRYHTHDNDSEIQEQKLKQLITIISEHDPEKLVSIRRRNGMDSLFISGMHNHRNDNITEIFKQIGIVMPGSYGILYIQDDEDINEQYDNSNCFIVWKLIRGHLIEDKDLFLSPFVPTVEDPYDSNRND